MAAMPPFDGMSFDSLRDMLRRCYPSNTWNSPYLDPTHLLDVDWALVVRADEGVMNLMLISPSTFRTVGDSILRDHIRLSPPRLSWVRLRDWQDVISMHRFCRDMKTAVLRSRQPDGTNDAS